MATKLGIFNLALARLGSDPVGAVDEDSNAALALSAVYDAIRDIVLADHPWNCAVRRAVLARLMSSVTESLTAEKGNLAGINIVPGTLLIHELRTVTGENVDLISRPVSPSQYYFTGYLANVPVAAGSVSLVIGGNTITDSEFVSLNYATGEFQTDVYPFLIVPSTGIAAYETDPDLADDGAGNIGSGAGTIDYATGAYEIYDFAIWNRILADYQGEIPPVFGYRHHCILPADCLRALGLVGGWNINPEDDPDNVNPRLRFKVEGGLLLTNHETPNLKYIAQITDEGAFEAGLESALAMRLAAETSYQLTGDKQLKDLLLKEYGLELSKAKSANAQEGSPEVKVSSTWADARQ